MKLTTGQQDWIGRGIVVALIAGIAFACGRSSTRHEMINELADGNWTRLCSERTPDGKALSFVRHDVTNDIRVVEFDRILPTTFEVIGGGTSQSRGYEYGGYYVVDRTGKEPTEFWSNIHQKRWQNPKQPPLARKA